MYKIQCIVLYAFLYYLFIEVKCVNLTISCQKKKIIMNFYRSLKVSSKEKKRKFCFLQFKSTFTYIKVGTYTQYTYSAKVTFSVSSSMQLDFYTGENLIYIVVDLKRHTYYCYLTV